jgi:hypothetical protein
MRHCPTLPGSFQPVDSSAPAVALEARVRQVLANLIES